MKNILFIRKQITGVALLTILSSAPLMTATAHAAPDPNPRASQNNDRRNSDKNRDDNRDSNRGDEIVGTVTNVRSGNSFDLSANGRTYNVYTSSSLPRGLSQGDRVSVSGRNRGDNDVTNARVSILDNNRNDPQRDDNNNGNSNNNGYEGYRNYDGTVEILLPGNEFNARINGRIYKIYATGSTSNLRVGDQIRMYGQLDRGVNIRNAQITKTGERNNGGTDNDGRDNTGDYGNRDGFNTYNGEVTDVRSNREFDVRIDGRIYRVYADKTTRDINRGDTVRVYGSRSGNNDIRNARVTLANDRYDNNNQNYGSYRNYTGIVTDVRSDREFDVRVDGKTYRVTTDNSTRDLNRGDEVRVYGRSYGDNDIRDASARVTRNR